MYRPTFRYQIGDPTTVYDAFECSFSSGAMALDFDTLGKIKVWGGTLLAQAHLTDADIRDGTNLQQVAKAWEAYGQTLTIKSGGYWADVVAALRQGRGVILQGDHDQLSAAARCSDFMGDHAIYLNPELNATGTAVLTGNPLCKAFQYVPLTQLQAFAEKLGRRVRNVAAGDPAPIYFAVTDAHPQAELTVTYLYGGKPMGRGSFRVKARVTANLRKSPYVRSDNVVQRLAPGTTFRCLQTTWSGSRVGLSSKWVGTADGRHWLHSSVVEYVGPITGHETIK